MWKSVFFFPELRDFVTHGTLVQRNGEQDWWDLTRNTCETALLCVNHYILFRYSADFGLHTVWSFLLFSEMHTRQVSMNIRTAKVCVPWFAIFLIEDHPNFLQNIFLWCWDHLLPNFNAIIPSVQYFVQQLLFKCKYRRDVPIHSHVTKFKFEAWGLSVG